MTDILYRSPALEVRRVMAGDGRRRVVTFDSYHEPPGTDRAGFGESFLQAQEISAIHVMSHGNDWFQYTEMMEVLEHIRAACTDAQRVMTYGSSMGGYAALRFAAAVGAQSALALSPQYSVDPRKAPFENRWTADRRRIRFIEGLERPIEQVPLMAVAFDSRLPVDVGHVLRLTGDAVMQRIPIPFAGHPVGPFLNEVGLLQPLVLSVLDGRCDRKYIRCTAWRRRKASPQWLANAAEHHPRAGEQRAILFARQAVALAPDHARLHDSLARILASFGRFAEALAAHRQAIALEPVIDYQWSLSHTLHRSGDLAAALEVAEQMQRLAPAGAGYHAWAARLREELGDWAGARDDLRRATKHDPANRGYRWRLLHARMKAPFRRGRRSRP